MSSTCDLETIQHMQSHLGVFHVCNFFELLAFAEAAYEEQRPEILECPMCLNFLGIGYTFGEGLAQDACKGLALVKKASDLGLKKAAYNLYRIYKDGDVIGKDLELSLKYCERAAELGDCDASKKIQEMRQLVRSKKIMNSVQDRFSTEDE